jgi:hypothetical protein
MLTNIRKKLVGLIFRKFVRNFTHICKRILQKCAKFEKSGLYEKSVQSNPQVTQELTELSDLHKAAETEDLPLFDASIVVDGLLVPILPKVTNLCNYKHL